MPFIFQARNLRSGPRFPNLRRHMFSIAEKQWLCGRLLHLQYKQRSRFCAKYGISMLAANEWIDAYRFGYQLEDGFCIPDDRPVDSIGMTAILNYPDQLYEEEIIEQQTDRLTRFLEIQLSKTIERRQDALNIEAQKSMRTV